ncbi:MAG: TlpA family protein disulfide reductase [Muribaculaceae bacterium]|nr:TlpA family protein disulfide reductase [Muribaculaceae bacterium]
MCIRYRLMAEYHAFNDSVFNANIDNPIAYIMYIDVADMQPVDSIKAFIEKYPVFAKSKRLQGYITAARNREATSPGHKFLDFTITTDSTSQKLSDFAGKGKPVLVDFWASWCGPCIRETKVLKELLAEFGPQGLEVLGVAVWDEPENTLEAIKNHKLPWPQIIGAQSVPTEAYGITSIPCIMLVAPDGTILTRGTQGDDLRNQVKAYFDGTLQPDTTAVIY